MRNFIPHSIDDDNDDDDDANNNGQVPNIPGGFQAMGAVIQGGDDDVDISECLIDYNAKFANSDPTLFRDEVINQTFAVLIGRTKPNALLVGPAGTGKTKIVEDIARRIAAKDPTVPDKLANTTIYELPLSAIVSGSSLVGQLESKMKALVEFMSDPDNDAIMFIDEIHMLASEAHGSYGKIAQILKPALARGDIRTIGATTLQEANDLVDDPAFNRRFSRIIVDELSQEQTTRILENMWGTLSGHYGNRIVIDDATFSLVTSMADQYSTSTSHRPDNAITLMDRACGDAIVERKAQEARLASDPAMLRMARTQSIHLTEAKVRKCAMRLMTGQTDRDAIDHAKLEDHLSEIIGQDKVIDKIKEVVELFELDLFPKTRPTTILCAGPSGVGKSAVAKIVAQELCGTEPITLNMTEYNSPAAVNRIIGSPAGYVGSDSHAELPFDVLESNPYQVILLDEMEKCDRSVQRLFMGAFDDGHIQTARGKSIDFSKAIVFVTTNATHSAGSTHACGFTNSDDDKSDSTMVSELSGYFDTEFLNRFQTILTFNEIGKDTYREIVADKYRREVKRIKSGHNRMAKLPDEMPADELEEFVDETYIAAFGARPAERKVRRYIENKALEQARARRAAVVTPVSAENQKSA